MANLIRLRKAHRGSRESGAVRPVANLIRLRKAHRGNRESGVGGKNLKVSYNYHKRYINHQLPISL
ncbi:MAG: hypothetical protein F6K26_03715 [Moorea sp. SIO2I5]|nr:hypothetical protein [Moorena sp. SIO2I5]